MRSFCELAKYSASDGATVLDVCYIRHQRQSYTEPYSDKLLPDLLPKEQDVFTLDLDLNETLTFKRPVVDAFFEHLAQFYEIVVYTNEQDMDLSRLNRNPGKVHHLSGHALEGCLSQRTASLSSHGIN
ncbi:Mitochondrial import inner membrane translocase subunit TIM50 [Glycine max]|nr:Mitochondrial import inner membrane translocase subunit TIM50 [Glycine max]